MKYKDKFGNPISINIVELLLRHPNYKIVKQENIGEYFLSTVWLAIEHLGGHYFETMVFSNIDSNSNELKDRYETLKEAEEGHERYAKELKNENKNSGN